MRWEPWVETSLEAKTLECRRDSLYWEESEEEEEVMGEWPTCGGYKAWKGENFC